MLTVCVVYVSGFTLPHDTASAGSHDDKLPSVTGDETICAS